MAVTQIDCGLLSLVSCCRERHRVETELTAVDVQSTSVPNTSRIKVHMAFLHMLASLTSVGVPAFTATHVVLSELPDEGV